MAIIDITKTQIYVISGAISTVASSLKVKDRVFFCGADKNFIAIQEQHLKSFQYQILNTVQL